MNRIDIFTGGHELRGVDLLHMQEGYSDGIGALARGVGNGILYGCRVFSAAVHGGTNISNIAEGFIAINGEVYYVPAQSWNITTITDWCLVPFEYVDSDRSPVVYADSSSKDVHIRRELRVEQYGAQSVKFRYRELGDYADTWHTVINPPKTFSFEIEYHPADDWESPSAAMLTDNFEGVKFRKEGRKLHIKGSAFHDAYADKEILFTLPNYPGETYYIPAKRRYLVISGISNADGVGDPDELFCAVIDPVDGAAPGTIVIKSLGTVPTGNDVSITFDHWIDLD